MAITVGLDPIQNNSTNTTGVVIATAFSPSAGDLIIVDVGSDTTATPSSYAITDSVGLTWHLIGRADFNQTAHQGAAAAWWAFSAAAHASMTVTVTLGLPAVSTNHSIKVTTLQGSDTVSPVNVTGTGTSAVNTISPSVTTSAPGCLAFMVALNMSFIGTVSSTDTIAPWSVAAHSSGGHCRKAAVTSPAGAVTVNASQVAGNAYAWTFLIWAIRPPAPLAPYVLSQNTGFF